MGVAWRRQKQGPIYDWRECIDPAIEDLQLINDL